MARERNGWIDNGRPISNASARCPNCNSTDYIETVSMEKCKTCGLEFDYWSDGAGGNSVYNAWSERAQREAELARRREEEAEDDEQYNWQSEDDS